MLFEQLLTADQKWWLLARLKLVFNFKSHCVVACITRQIYKCQHTAAQTLQSIQVRDWQQALLYKQTIVLIVIVCVFIK